VYETLGQQNKKHNFHGNTITTTPFKNKLLIHGKCNRMEKQQRIQCAENTVEYK